MPRTFGDKLFSEIKDKWLVLKCDKSTFYIMVNGNFTYKKRGVWADEGYIKSREKYVSNPYEPSKEAFIGYYIEITKGRPYTFEDIEEFFDPLKESDKVKSEWKLDISTILRCYKLTDAELRQKLDRLLAKRLLHGSN